MNVSSCQKRSEIAIRHPRKDCLSSASLKGLKRELEWKLRIVYGNFIMQIECVVLFFFFPPPLVIGVVVGGRHVERAVD